MDLTGPDTEALYDPEEHEGMPAEEAELDDLAEDIEPDAIDLLRAEVEEYKQMYLRQLAEFQTFRRRTMDEKDQLRKTATENLVTELVPVLDNFERTLAAAQSGADLDALTGGVAMVERQLRIALGSVGLVRIQAVGHAFDPNVHEALGTDPASEQAPAGTITVEIEPGYMMAEKVIRPARVRVAQ
ncbi:MAG: nucleotide exchange factor GrpE [Armatimonadetes bacterium]|nr:nucleotide exchange factor GrpE [Armatimonadota bacterium]